MPSLLQTVLSILALLLSLVLLVSGNTMLGTLVALRLEIEGYSAARAGLILSFHSVGFVLGSLYGIRIIRRVGHIRAFAVFGAIACAAILVHPLHVHPELWLTLRLIVGFCIAGLFLIVESWVNAIATTQTRGSLLGIYLVSFYLAASSGQLLIGFGNPAQFQLFAVAAILVALSLVPLSLTRSVAPQLPEAQPVSLYEIWKLSPLPLIGAMLCGISMSAFSSMGPIYATRIGLDTTELSYFMSLAVLSAMLVQWPVGKLSDSFPRNRVLLALGLSGLAAAAIAAAWGDQSLILLFASTSLFVGLAACLYPISLAMAHDQMGHEQIVGTNATLLLGYGIGTIAGPIGGSIAIWLVGPGGLFVFVACALGALGIAASHFWQSQPRIPVQEQEVFVAVGPVSTSALLELDPRDETYEEREEAAREHQDEANPYSEQHS